MARKQRHIAFYLPQFHPVPQNDDWWGPGFTEWHNVVRARPRYRGHSQPHIPADLGFYDLRLPESRAAQAHLAQEYGIDGLCYYHYWFGGTQILERPFQEVLRTGDPSLPFCLCWANEDWTRSWSGRDGTVLIRQDYEQDQARHAAWLVEAFRDERYIRVEGKPLFLVYRAAAMPDPRRITRLWRDTARAAGVGELFLCRVESFPEEHGDPRELGFDAAVEFAPDWNLLTRGSLGRLEWAASRIGAFARANRLRSFDYRRHAAAMLSKPAPEYLRFPCVTPRWDNTPRRSRNAVMLRGSTPDLYARWVAEASTRAPETDSGESLVFVNAWNEWGEGAHLEPCLQWGRGYLEAHLAARLSLETAGQ